MMSPRSKQRTRSCGHQAAYLLLRSDACILDVAHTKALLFTTRHLSLSIYSIEWHSAPTVLFTSVDSHRGWPVSFLGCSLLILCLFHWEPVFQSMAYYFFFPLHFSIPAPGSRGCFSHVRVTLAPFASESDAILPLSLSSSYIMLFPSQGLLFALLFMNK